MSMKKVKDFYYVETMDYEQIFDFINSDYENYKKRFLYNFDLKKFKKEINQERFFLGDNSMIMCDYYHFKRHNLDYYSIPYVTSFNHYKETDIIHLLNLVTFIKNGKLYAAQINSYDSKFDTKNISLSFIEPHLIDRYIERIGNEDLVGERLLSIVNFLIFEVGGTFLKQNYEYTFNDNSFISKTKNGVIFGCDYKKYDVFKTFVRKDMLFDTQNKYITNDSKIRSEILSNKLKSEILNNISA